MSGIIGFILIFSLALLIIGIAVRSAIVSVMHKAAGNTFSRLINAAEEEEPQKSVSGGDSIYLPRILEDFPDFSLITAKGEVRKRIEEEMAPYDGLKIHATAISDYKKAGFESEIVFQCAFEVVPKGLTRKEQKRYCMHYVFSAEGGPSCAGMTCPNCGAPIKSTSATHCEYCDCRLVNMTGASWKFTQVYEK